MKPPLVSIESRSPTIRDWMWGVLAISLALAWRMGPALGGGAVGFSLPAYIFVLLGIYVLLCVALWVAVLVGWGRQLQYRRKPKAAECLGVAILSFGLVHYFPNLDTAIQAIHDWLKLGNQFDFSRWRWGLSAAGLALVFFCNIVAFTFVRKFAFVWLLPMLALWLIVLRWGLFVVLIQESRWPFLVIGSMEASFFLHDAILSLPSSLAISIPTLAVVRSFRSQRANWIWNEWVAALAALLMGAMLAAVLVWPLFLANSPERLLLAIVGLGWVGALYILSSFVLHCQAMFCILAWNPPDSDQNS